MIDKIYIAGPVGAGKSTLARRLAKEYGFFCCELDSVVYEPNPDAPNGNRKRTPEARDALLADVLSRGRWIVEDAGRDCFDCAMRQAESILLLEPPVAVRLWRIVTRWVRQNIGLERCGYIPDWEMLRLMFQWTRKYETDGYGLRARLNAYADKITRVCGEREVRRYIRQNLEKEPDESGPIRQ